MERRTSLVLQLDFSKRQPAEDTQTHAEQLEHRHMRAQVCIPSRCSPACAKEASLGGMPQVQLQEGGGPDRDLAAQAGAYSGR